jgi:hypothetical protein
MRIPTEVPAGLLAVPCGKGCILLLTPQEITTGIRRGKCGRRLVAMEQRIGETVPTALSTEGR